MTGRDTDMTRKPDKQGTGTALATVGAGLALVVCCGLPVLIAAGGLGAVGSVLGNGWVIGTAIAVAVSGVLWLVQHHRSPLPRRPVRSTNASKAIRGVSRMANVTGTGVRR